MYRNVRVGSVLCSLCPFSPLPDYELLVESAFGLFRESNRNTFQKKITGRIVAAP
jgi:hypothetical protein